MTHIDAIMKLRNLKAKREHAFAKAARSLREQVIQEVCRGETLPRFAASRLSHLVYLKVYDHKLEAEIFDAEVMCLKTAIEEGLMT